MKRIICLLFFLQSLPFFAQETKSITINWEKGFNHLNQSITTSEKVYINEYNVPLYSEKFLLKNNHTQLQNISFNIVDEQIMTLSDVAFYRKENFTNSPNFKLEVMNERGKFFGVLVFNPIYVKNGQFVKINSCTVSYLSTENSKKNFIKRNNSVQNSVLASGKWFKIAVSKTGVYKLDQAFLKSLGIDITSVNPKNIRIYGNGGGVLPENAGEVRLNDLTENDIYVSGENDGVFNNEDFVLFYGKGPDNIKYLDESNITHAHNVYDNYGYYFVNVDLGLGSRIKTTSFVDATPDQIISDFTDVQIVENDLKNYGFLGRTWFGQELNSGEDTPFNFNFPNVVSSKPMYIEAGIGASSSSSSMITLAYEGNELVADEIGAKFSNFYSSVNLFASVNPVQDQVSLSFNWSNEGNLSGEARLDYLKVIATRALKATGGQFGFVNLISKNTNDVLKYSIENKSLINFVWDVTEPTFPKLMESDPSNLISYDFIENADSNLNKYHVVNFTDTMTPVVVQTNVANQNLHSLQDVHYVIVTTEPYVQQAERLANYHRNNSTISSTNSNKLNVKVVTLSQVYNEFSSGATDITAIRDFVKYLYDNATTEDNKIKYLCLFGDGSYDYRGIINNKNNIVPTYSTIIGTNLKSSYISDDYFGEMDASDYSGTDGFLKSSAGIDVATGRLPFSDLNQATNMVNKILNYKSSNTKGAWKNLVTFLGDDGAEGSDQSLIKFLEVSAQKIEANNDNFNLVRLYSDAFKETITSAGGRYPDIKKRFLEAFSKGSLVVNYFGHGNEFGLGGENFLDIADIKQMKNINNLPLFITVTCDFSRFDNPNIVSAGEEMIRNQYGSVVAMITTTREIFISSGDLFNRALSDYLYDFDGEKRTVGEAMKDAKNYLQSSTDELFIYLFGDPAMRLSIPDDGIVIDAVKKYEFNATTNTFELNDTTELNGLSKVKIKGHVAVETDLSQVLTSFNGDITFTLFDQPINRSTLLNEGTGSTVNFNSLENKLFVGQATVKDGVFEFDFVMPKDLSFNLGTAKFSFYASSNTLEKKGSDFSVKVGGLDTNAVADTTAPTASLYLDNESFIDGGTINANPILIAKLKDTNGINTSINSVGHNITVVVDNNFNDPIILNDYYMADKDDYTSGVVTYQMPELSKGKHVLTFKAWDTYNNSVQKTLNLNVEEDDQFKLSGVLNYPNPFINHTEFWYKNNKTGEPLETKVQIFTVSGKLVKTIIASDNNLSGLSRSITWDGKDDFGNKLAKGVYLYRITAKQIISGETAEAVEKLVIL